VAFTELYKSLMSAFQTPQVDANGSATGEQTTTTASDASHRAPPPTALPLAKISTALKKNLTLLLQESQQNPLVHEVFHMQGAESFALSLFTGGVVAE